MDEYDATGEDAAGGGPGYYHAAGPHHQHQFQGSARQRGPGPSAAAPPPRFQSRQQWQPWQPWPKHDGADGPPPGPGMRPSSSPRPVLELRSDAHVPPDLISPRSDSFFYSSRPAARPCPSPTPTISHFPPASRTRAESSPTHRPPRSAFPGLSSNPFIPESPEPESEPELAHAETRKFPLLSRQHEQLARLSPVSNHESPTESRQGTPTEASMAVENFSRPRKTSVKSQQSDGALSRRTAAHRLHAEPPLSDQPPTGSGRPQAAAINNLNHPGPNAWPMTRRLSGSSSQSSSTFSSIPPRPSNDQLGAAPRGDSLRHHPHPVIPAPQAAFPRPPPTHYNHNAPQHHRELPPWVAAGDEFRSSFRSQFTSSTAQATFFTANGTERNSVLTKASSITEQSIINGYARMSWRPNSVDDGPSLEDVMGMYERGFNDSDIESIRRSMRFPEDDDHPETDTELPGMPGDRPISCHSDASGLRAKVLEAMNDSLPTPKAIPTPESDNSARLSRTRRSMLPSSLPKEISLGFVAERMSKRAKSETGSINKHDSASMLDTDDESAELPDKHDEATSPTSPTSTSSQGQAPSTADSTSLEAVPPPAAGPRLPQEPPEDPGSRDRYGFRKAGANITRQEYDAWNATYTEYLARRRKKWIAFLKDNSLMTDRPNRFPPRGAKTKRFIRKGIPPDWRGAAWFYYAGGPAILSKHRGVYEQLVRRAGLDFHGQGRNPDVKGEVKPLIVEDIEKDLYRTFPDNVRFKPPPPPPGTLPGQSPPPEPEIIGSLRRVLNAFALYNPRIGYCQSLNFLAGLLLLFVETEEQAFWLLNIITRVYLPGTHEMSLEGSKVDLGVLMVALKDSLPGVWKQIGGDELDAGKKGGRRRGAHKFGHGGNPGSVSDPNRLPAITLCMTAWFMSCFIGTLPIETVLRVWDVFFYEGSRTLFRIALTIFKLGEREIKAVQDPMEMFGVVQTFPRRMIDCNTLLETCYKRRNGIGHLSQELVEERRKERRDGLRKWKAEQDAAASDTNNNSPRPGTRHKFGAAALGLDLATDLDEVRRKANLFGRRKDREQARAAEVA